MKNTLMYLCLSATDVMKTLDGEKSHCYTSVFRIITLWSIEYPKYKTVILSLEFIFIGLMNKFKKFHILPANCLWSRCMIYDFKKLFFLCFNLIYLK